nr:hypothetical protein BaRGS_014164 [Batillaria attramentaria]
MTDPVLGSEESSDNEAELLKPGYKDAEGNKILNGITISKTELKADKTRLYNFTKIKKNRRWLRTILLSDSSSEDEEDERPISHEDLQSMLKVHKYQKKHQMRYYQNPELRKYQYYSTGLLSNYDKYPEHHKSVVGPKKKISKEQKKIEKKAKAKLKKLRKDKALLEEDDEDEIDPALLALLQKQQARKERTPKKLTPEQADAKRRKIWTSIAKKEIPRVEKEHRKRAEKEAQEQRKHDLELMEARRQQRKLNFLITQTELYAHFMARKMTGEGDSRRDAILNQLNDGSSGSVGQRQVDGGVLVDIEGDTYSGAVWGNAQDRKILRKFWDSKSLHTESASFHVVITSYQLVIQDVKYFQRIKWQYLVLDEAQAIKSTSSVRWKILLGFNCRNRLLLTGTPIQNSMAELWALLHFIMPTLFDSHDEFNEWFSKDIESHAERQSGIDADQLSRLHMILKPFMLRRVKKDVENELSDKIEIMVNCPLTKRQKQLYDAIKKKISIEDLLQSSSASSSQAQSTTSSLMNLVMQFRKVCNHPELFERKEPKTPYYMCLEDYNIPKVVYRDGIVLNCVPSKAHLTLNKFYLHSPSHVHVSLQPQSGNSVDSCFSFLRLINMSPAEFCAYMFGGLLVRWMGIFLASKAAYRIHHCHTWGDGSFTPRTCLLMSPEAVTSPPNLSCSQHLQRLVFISATGTVYTHAPHKLHFIPETAAHRQIRARHSRLARKALHSPPTSPTKAHSPIKSPTLEELTLPVHPHKRRPPCVLDCQPTSLPVIVWTLVPKVMCRSRGMYVVDRSAAWDTMRKNLCGTLEARQSLLYGTPELYWEQRWPSARFTAVPSAGLCAVRPRFGWHAVQIPDKESLVSDAGKLYVLDSLLQRLKQEGHRVLIYSQMTRMIDLLEEYMVCRKHTYMRLDGSSKISDRRDMVADFQNRSDIFVFLLSTRAGGLGINLTAADTVIFYDSDWNPTVDQQAMDRAHRLGQTKQVTVYRLICQGTIEERILQRAKEKSEWPAVENFA